MGRSSKRKLHQLFGEGLPPRKRGKLPKVPAPEDVDGLLHDILMIERFLNVVDPALAWFFGSTRWKEWTHIRWDLTLPVRVFKKWAKRSPKKRGEDGPGF
jgi:hypothetical protein